MSPLRTIRTARGFTLDDAVENLDCSKSWLSRLERNPDKLTMKWVRDLAVVYGCSEIELLGFDIVEAVSLVLLAEGYRGERSIADIAESIATFAVLPADELRVYAEELKVDEKKDVENG